MVDKREHQHRPRTSYRLAQRLKNAAISDGVDVRDFHDALKYAVKKLEKPDK